MVFFFQQPIPNGHGWVPDLSPAAPFGDFSFVFDVEDRPSKTPQPLLKKAKEALANFDHRTDYVCWCNSGDVSSIYVVIGILAKMGVPYIKTLNWHRPKPGEENGYYVPSQIPLN
jgi:hypothetical protein